jgi:multidrug efflux system membrane fusion protein
LLLLAFGIWSLLAKATAPPLPPPESVRFVRTAAVVAEIDVERLRLPGLLRATKTAELAFLQTGQLAERRVIRGQAVETGALLALLYNSALNPGLNAADARLNEVRTQLEQVDREQRRLQDLHDRNLVSTEELERMVARRDALAQVVDQAEAEQERASEQLAEASLRAPFAGTIMEVLAEPGEFVAAGQAVVILAGHGSLEVALDLGAERAARLAPGQSARIRAPNGSGDHAATVVEVGLAGPGRPAPVRLRMDQAPADWRPGLAVEAELVFTNPERLSVPLSAVVDPGSGQPRIFRINDDRATLIPIALGPVRGGRVIIDGPVAPGDQVVIAGHSQLLDQETVRVLP